MRRALGCGIAVALVFAGSADARTVTAKNIRSPSGLITCISVAYSPYGIECSATYLPSRHLDPYYSLRRHGRAGSGERGDYPGYPGTRQHTLNYGDVWKRPGIRCTIGASAGLRCTNEDGHGFVLVKGNPHRF